MFSWLNIESLNMDCVNHYSVVAMHGCFNIVILMTVEVNEGINVGTIV